MKSTKRDYQAGRETTFEKLIGLLEEAEAILASRIDENGTHDPQAHGKNLISSAAHLMTAYMREAVQQLSRGDTITKVILRLEGEPDTRSLSDINGERWYLKSGSGTFEDGRQSVFTHFRQIIPSLRTRAEIIADSCAQCSDRREQIHDSCLEIINTLVAGIDAFEDNPNTQTLLPECRISIPEKLIDTLPRRDKTGNYVSAEPLFPPAQEKALEPPPNPFQPRHRMHRSGAGPKF